MGLAPALLKTQIQASETNNKKTELRPRIATIPLQRPGLHMPCSHAL